MADRTFIIETILRARDDMASAFAKATAEMKAFNALQDQQIARQAKAAEAQKRYVEEFEEGTAVTKRRRAALEEAELKSVRAARAQVELEHATRNLTRAQEEGKASTAEIAALTSDLTSANQKYIKAVREGEHVSDSTARRRAARVRQDIEGEYRVVAAARDRESALRAIDKIEDDLASKNRKRGLENKRIVEDMEKAEQRLQARRVQVAERAMPSIRTLSRADVTPEQEINAERKLVAARQELVQTGLKSHQVDELIHSARRQALSDYGFESQAARDAVRDQERLSNSKREYTRLINDLAVAKRRADQLESRPGGLDRETYREAKVKVDADLGEAEARVTAFVEKHRDLEVNVKLDLKRAMAEYEAFQKRTSSRGGSGDIGGIVGDLNRIKKTIDEGDTSVRGFQREFRDAFGFAAMMFIAPLISLLGGLVGALTAVASAAVAAGGGLVALFGSVMAQGAPAVGLLFAAMMRLRSVLGLVTQEHQKQQQEFLANYQTAQQNAIGINQVANAQHAYQEALHGITVAQWNYRDAVFNVTRSEQNLQTAQLNLLNTRREAKRQIEDLVMAERQARLEFDQSSLSITDAQKALANAVATGGDVEQAQLNLRNAQMGHEQAATRVSRAGQDANRALRQGVEGSQQVTQARRAVVDAERGIIDAKRQAGEAARAIQNAAYQAQQARAAILQARQASTGYNAAANAQSAWLRSQMTATELALSRHIKRIVDLVTGPTSPTRKLTDQILAPFIPLTDRIYDILNNPKFFGAFLNLSKAMGDAIGQIGNTLLSNEAVNGVIKLVNSAADNMKPLATIVGDFFHIVGDAMVIAAPFVHQFLTWLSGVADKWVKWMDTTKGKNTLKDFFDVAFEALKAFLKLGASVARLIFDIVTVGGGAKEGTDLLDGLRKKIDDVSTSIENHGKAWKVLQDLWKLIGPALDAIGTVFGAIAEGLAEIAASGDGKKMLDDLAALIADYLVPAFVKFVHYMSVVVGGVLHFFRQHPKMAQIATDLAAIGLAMAALGKAFGLFLGPIGAVVGWIGKLAVGIKLLKGAFAGAGAAEGAAETGGILAAIGISGGTVLIIAAVAAAVIGLAAATGNLGKLWDTIKTPFEEIWKKISEPLSDLGKQITYFVNGILAPFGGRVKNVGDIVGKAFSAILTVAKVVFGTIGKIIGDVFGGAIKIISGVFEVIGGIIHGDGRKIIEGFKKIGEGIVKGLWGALLEIPKLLLNLIKKMVGAVLHWLGISSPSTRMHGIGQAMVEGLWNGLKAIVGFAGKILGWIGEGIGKLIGWALGLGKRIVRGILHGAQQVWEDIKSIGSAIPGWIWNGIKNLGTAIFNIGKWIVKKVVDGIKDAPSIIEDAIKSLIPGLGGGGEVTIHGRKAHKVSTGIGLATGGGVGSGYGGGDRVPAVLEEGEHVWTKEEVAAAGGHGVMYALRALFGGGGQARGSRMAEGGAARGGTVTDRITNALANIITIEENWGANFSNKWDRTWDYIRNRTNQGTKQQIAAFNNLADGVKDAWNRINNNTTKQLDKMMGTFNHVLTRLDKAIFNAFWYIGMATNVALKAFNAKPVDIHLGAIPKFAGGGVIGKLGERGADMVPAILGRGEAVLNWAHQRVIEPALRKMYGFGLGELFQKVKGEHAARAMTIGMAGGGYTGPGESGAGFIPIWNLAKQKFGMTNMTGFLGHSKYSSSGLISDHWAHRALDMSNGVNTPQEFALNNFFKFKVPQIVKQLIWQAVDQLRGWNIGDHYDHVHLAMPDQYAFDEMRTAKILSAAEKGLDFKSLLVSTPGASPSLWTDIKNVVVKGSGAMYTLARRAINKVRDAANKFGQSMEGQFGSQYTGQVAGANFWDARQKILRGKVSTFGPPLEPAGSTSLAGHTSAEPGLSLHVPGTHFSDPINLALRGSRFMTKIAGHMAELMDIDVGPADYLNRVIDVTGAGAYKMGIDPHNFPTDTYGEAKWVGAHAGGGFAGEGKPVPVVAHVGEWILNKAQQSRLARAMRTTVGGLASFLGLSGGKTSFADGGVVGMANEFIRMVMQHMPQQWQSTPPGARGVRFDAPAQPRTALPKFLLPTRKQGAFDEHGFAIETVAWTQQALRIFNQAQESLQSVKNLRKWHMSMGKSIDRFLNNLRLVSGQDGLFAQAASAIENAASHQANITNMLAVGLRVITRHGRQILQRTKPLTELQAAQRGLADSEREGKDLERLRNQEATTLADINREIGKLGDPKKMNQKQRDQYKVLLGRRKEMMDRLDDTDSKIIQNREDQFEKSTAAFQADLDAKMRDSTQKLQKLRQGRGGLRIAQAFGLTDLISRPGGLNDQVTAQLEDQQKVLQAKYTEAVRKHGGDPRWQKTIDDLLSQVQDAISAVAEAQAQALSDRISKAEADHQRVTAHYDVLDRLAQVRAGYGDRLGAAQAQIGTQGQRVSELAGFRQQYEQLLQEARATGNQGAILDLTAKLEDLDATMQEANLKTQQLITEYRKMSLDQLLGRGQREQGLFGAAKNIVTALNSLMGSQSTSALIKYVKQAGDALRNMAQGIISEVNKAMSDQSFGENQGQANQWLAAARDAFTQGPQAFADWLSANAQGLAAFEATLPDDQKALFQGLIDSMTDNTLATIDNSQQLKDLQGQQNQQDWSSSAWTMFREAIFNGMGGLLPQYAAAAAAAVSKAIANPELSIAIPTQDFITNVPSMDTGGFIKRSGLLYGHRGEMITPAAVVKTGGGNGQTTNIDVNITNPTEVADPVYLGNAIAWRLNHDPNSR